MLRVIPGRCATLAQQGNSTPYQARTTPRGLCRGLRRRVLGHNRSPMTSPPRYAPVPIALHWLMAALLIVQLALGLWMIGLPKSPPGLRAGWFNVHKSIGMVLGLLLLARLVARWRWPAPAHPATLPRWQHHAANLTHALLYLCLLVMPLSGLLGSGFTPYPVKFFGLALPRWTEPWPAAKDFCSALHQATAWLLLAALALHLAGALWHLARGDGIGRRMGLGR
jgi:cytochrome b561